MFFLILRISNKLLQTSYKLTGRNICREDMKKYIVVLFLQFVRVAVLFNTVAKMGPISGQCEYLVAYVDLTGA